MSARGRNPAAESPAEPGLAGRGRRRPRKRVPRRALRPHRTRLRGRRAIDPVLRTFDIAISGTALILLSPLVAVVAAATLVTSGRPVLYKGDRVGRAGRVFSMYKFRTLAADAETRLGPYLGTELTERTEAELTGVGRALRPTHLDEVPQLWNVLRGDMSIVGPARCAPPSSRSSAS